MAIKDWRSCAGVNKRTGKIKPGFKAVKGKCPVSTHHEPSVTDLVSSTAASTTSLGRSRRGHRRGLGAIVVPSGKPAAWAHKHFSEAKTLAELEATRRTMMNPWTGMGRYYDSRTGIAKQEIDSVYRQHRARFGR